MIERAQGDLLRASVEALVNAVNCEGVMGRGIAAQFKRAFPANFVAYAQARKRREVQPGRMFTTSVDEADGPRWIINFPTKRHWRSHSRLDDVDAGLVALVAEVRRLELRSIAIPPLGCGLGGLDWAVVRPRIEQALAQVPDVRVLCSSRSSAGVSAEGRERAGGRAQGEGQAQARERGRGRRR
ncbi:MAG: macro domain-containing protein [Kofleriaceae bacterium]|nr:macro domain-containing protein [Kofleriaceae bacterium]